MKHLFAFLILLPLFAHAKDITVTITPATTNTDGSVLTDLAAHRIEYGSCGAGDSFATKIGEATVQMPALISTLTGFNPAKYCFRAYSKNTAGTESAPTNVVAFTVVASTPNAPTIRVTAAVIGPTAYSVIKSDQQLVLLPVGTVPLGTACDTAQGVVRGGNVFNVVPTSAVTFNGTARPLVTLASCG